MKRIKTLMLVAVVLAATAVSASADTKLRKLKMFNYTAGDVCEIHIYGDVSPDVGNLLHHGCLPNGGWSALISRPLRSNECYVGVVGYDEFGEQVFYDYVNICRVMNVYMQ